MCQEGQRKSRGIGCEWICQVIATEKEKIPEILSEARIEFGLENLLSRVVGVVS
jgi:hypothetical protein